MYQLPNCVLWTAPDEAALPVNHGGQSAIVARPQLMPQSYHGQAMMFNSADLGQLDEALPASELPTSRLPPGHSSNYGLHLQQMYKASSQTH